MSPISKALERRREANFQESLQFLSIGSGFFEELPAEKHDLLHLPSVCAFKYSKSSISQTSIFVDTIFNSLCDFICAPTTSTDFDEAFVTMLHLNLVETDAREPTQTMALAKERECNKTPSRLWVASTLKEYSYVSSQNNNYYVILIAELIAKREITN